MQCWDVLAANATGKTDPQVLFSTPEARMVMIDLAAGEQLGDHGVHERAIIQVARGSIELTSARGATICAQGSVEFAKMLVTDAQVAVSPGVGFGKGGEGFVRFALIENEQRIGQAMRSQRRGLDRLQPASTAR